MSLLFTTAFSSMCLIDKITLFSTKTTIVLHFLALNCADRSILWFGSIEFAGNLHQKEDNVMRAFMPEVASEMLV